MKNLIMHLERIPVRFFLRKISRIKMIPVFKTQSRSLISITKLHQISRINNLIYRINIIFFKLKFFHQKVQDFLARSIAGHLNRERRFSLNQNIFHCMNKVFTGIFINSKVGISGNLKEKCLFNLKSREQLCSILSNNILQKRKLTALCVSARKPVNI